MKRSIIKSIAIASIITVSWSCSMEMHVPEPSFEIEGYDIEQTVDTLGNAVYQVSFQLSGDPDIVSFYSGQIGNDYQYKDGRLVDFDALNLSFSTNVQFGNQADQFSVKVSSDFDGNYTLQHVTEADWTDITEDFMLGKDASFVQSGIKDIKAYKKESTPLYIAFKYTYRPKTEAGTANIWRVNNFQLSGTTAIGNISIADQKSGAWTFVDNFIDVPGRATIGGNGNIMLANGNNGASTEIAAEAWCVSKAFDLDVIDNGPDRA